MKYTTIFLQALFILFAVPAFSSEIAGMAKPWQLGFMDPATPVMEGLVSTHDMLMVIITVITIFVTGLLAYICLRFRRKANPIPSKTTHNVKIEIIWTVLPILILVAIAIPSLRLHYFIADDNDPDMTIKVVGYQWYWHYEYPDHGGFGYDSYMKKKEDLEPGEPRLLAVDNKVVVPVDTKVRVLLTAGDVIHAWAMPAFGVKRDAVPGRLNSSWFKATKIGTYYGQCSELCGVGHGFMPIRVDVVSQEDFDVWVKEQQKEAGITPTVEEMKEPSADAKSNEESEGAEAKKAEPVILKKADEMKPAKEVIVKKKIKKAAKKVPANKPADKEQWIESGWGDE